MHLGKNLYRLQMGERVGTARQGADNIFRVFYYLASPKGVLVFHAFVKKTQQTPPLEIELARKRLKELLDE